MQVQFGLDAASLDYESLSVRTLVTLATIVANDPTEGAMVYKMFLDRLDEVIELRKYQSAQYTLKNTDDEEYKTRYDNHLHFIQELAQVFFGWFCPAYAPNTCQATSGKRNVVARRLSLSRHYLWEYGVQVAIPIEHLPGWAPL